MPLRGSEAPTPPVPDQSEKRCIDPKLDQNPAPKFDWKFYVSYHKDLSYLTNESAAYQHWITQGKQENRPGSAAELLVTELKDSQPQLPANFSVEDYLSCNPDLQSVFQDNPYGAIVHFLKYGKQEGRLYSRDQLFFSDWRSQPLAPTGIQPCIQSEGESCSAQRVAILVQLYHLAEWERIYPWIQNFDGYEFDLFIGLSEQKWTPEIHAQLRQHCPSARILITRNQERDIYGHLALLSQIIWHEYDIFCWIRASQNVSLKSGSKSGSQDWKTAQDAIVGSKEIVAKNLAILRSHRAIGLMGTRKQGQNAFAPNSALLIKRQVLQPIYDRFHGVSESEAIDNKPSNSSITNQPIGAEAVPLRGGEAHTPPVPYESEKRCITNQPGQTLERLIHYIAHAQGLKFYWQEPQ